MIGESEATATREDFTYVAERERESIPTEEAGTEKSRFFAEMSL